MAQKESRFGLWLLLLLAAGGGVYGYRYYRKSDAKDVEYRSAAVTRGDLLQTVTANGQLEPIVNVQVGSQVSGIITNLTVDFNSIVTNGQLIAELDPATFRARVLQAEGELASAQAQLELAQVNARRAGELVKNNLIPRSDHDQAVAELHQREASVKMRQASLESALVDFGRTKIFSPIDGTVISRNVDIGQTVAASFTAPTLFLIANDLARMEIGAMVSEADIGGVALGQEATFTVEAFQQRTFTGRVSQVRNMPTTNNNVVTYASMIEVHNQDLKLKPGMTAFVNINTAKREKALRVPNAALRFRPPEDAILRTNTSTTAAQRADAAASSASGTNAAQIASVPAGAADGERRPRGEGGRGGSQPNDEMRQRMLQRFDRNGDGQLDESERQAMREEFRAQGGGGGRGGFGGSRSRQEASSVVTRTAYLVSTNTTAAGKAQVELTPVTVKTGVSDGAFTEILDGLKEGDVVAVGTISAQAAPTGLAAGQQPQRNPFGGGFGRRF
jgi:HlyD family secretion protein